MPLIYLTETARHAVRYACSLGSRYDAEVHVLHVIPDIMDIYALETGITLNDADTRKIREELNQEAVEEALGQIRQRIRETSPKLLEEIPQCPLEAEKDFSQFIADFQGVSQLPIIGLLWYIQKRPYPSKT